MKSITKQFKDISGQAGLLEVLIAVIILVAVMVPVVVDLVKNVSGSVTGTTATLLNLLPLGLSIVAIVLIFGLASRR
jgi:phage-related holin